jgi:hypothetical protein
LLRHRLHTVALITLSVAWIVLAGASSAEAEAVRRIGILVTTKVNVSDEQVIRVSATLGEVVHERFGVDVIAGAEAVRRLPPRGVSTRCVADVECRLELGRRLDAEELLLLVMIGAGGRLQIDPTWVDVASGKVTSRPAIELEPEADMRAVLTRAAPALLPHLRERSPEPAPAAAPAAAAAPAPEVVVVAPGPAAGSERRFTTATWIATGVSAGALIGATVFSMSSRRKFDTLDGDGCRSMPCSKDDIDDLRRDTLLADVFFGTALVAAGAAVVFFVISDSEGPAAQPGLSVGPGPGSVGLSLGGAF